MKNKGLLVDMMTRELELRKTYIVEPIQSIYFGGGTPSVLTGGELEMIFEKIHGLFHVKGDAEITIELNPEDVNRPYIENLRKLGINRLSMGIQSFRDKDLKFMNRIHTAAEAENGVKLARDTGIDNINIDLIYGIPGSNVHDWENNLKKAMALGIKHLSAYHLTIEPKTVFHYYKKKGKLQEVDENSSYAQFNLLREITGTEGFDHYEISNFCREGYHSRHNLMYWRGGHYLGVGPSAHSYNGVSRQWNVAINARYIEKVKEGRGFFTREELDAPSRYNDYVITSARTKWGIDMARVEKDFPRYYDHALQAVENQLRFGNIVQHGHQVSIPPGKFIIADRIMEDFIAVDS
jgi:oxygen-independent coproporphyrinogen-3 oxidase